MGKIEAVEGCCFSINFVSVFHFSLEAYSGFHDFNH